MSEFAKGGANKVEFFTVDSTHENIGASAVFSGDLIESTNPTRQDDGEYQISFTQLQDDPLFHDFLNTYAPVNEATGGSEVTLEDGTKVGGTTAASSDLLMYSYGPTIDDGTEKRKLWIGIIKVSTSSGSYTQQQGEFSKPNLEVISQKQLATLAVEGKLLSTLCSTTPTISLLPNEKGRVYFQVTS